MKCNNLDHGKLNCEENEKETDLDKLEDYQRFFKCLKCSFWNEKQPVKSKNYKTLFKQFFFRQVIQLFAFAPHIIVSYVRKN